MNCYVFVETTDLTQAMRNRANQPFVEKQVTVDAVEYYLVEINRDELVLTNIFDGYVWHSADSAKTIKDSGTFS